MVMNLCRRRGWAPLCSTASVCCRGLLQQEPVCVIYIVVAAHTCRYQSSLSCLTASLAAMGTAYRERSRLPPLSFRNIASLAFSLLSIQSMHRGKSLFCASSQAQWPDSRRRYPATSAHLEDAGLILDLLSVSIWASSGPVSSGWCAERFPVSLCFTLNWKTPIPCPAFGTVVIMSPASAATASESSTTTVPEEESESPREEVRTHCFQCSGQFSYPYAWGCKSSP